MLASRRAACRGDAPAEHGFIVLAGGIGGFSLES